MRRKRFGKRFRPSIRVFFRIFRELCRDFRKLFSRIFYRKRNRSRYFAANRCRVFVCRLIEFRRNRRISRYRRIEIVFRIANVPTCERIGVTGFYGNRRSFGLSHLFTVLRFYLIGGFTIDERYVNGLRPYARFSNSRNFITIETIRTFHIKAFFDFKINIVRINKLHIFRVNMNFKIICAKIEDNGLL